jgi:hypothetical protein
MMKLFLSMFCSTVLVSIWTAKSTDAANTHHAAIYAVSFGLNHMAALIMFYQTCTYAVCKLVIALFQVHGCIRTQFYSLHPLIYDVG